jgi:pyruvate kinase
MNYEIIATLGPGNENEITWQEMISAGVTAFRLNTSHLSLDRLRGWLDRISRFYAETGFGLPVVLDLQGSKWRVGDFAAFNLVEGQLVELILAGACSQSVVLPVPHADFFSAAGASNSEIRLNDAKIRLELQSITENGLTARVIQGGKIYAHKGITYQASEYRVETISEKDRAILEQTRQNKFIRYAISYVRDALEMSRYRLLFGQAAYLIAKLERGPTMEDASSICGSANELWVCRGDLGAELGLPGMARAVARFTEQIRDFRAPALMAGQVLEHMTQEPTPTRSEVCYLYDSLAGGYRGFVLSDEAAIGQYPLESCRAAAMFRAETYRIS